MGEEREMPERDHRDALGIAFDAMFGPDAPTADEVVVQYLQRTYNVPRDAVTVVEDSERPGVLLCKIALPRTVETITFRIGKEVL
jgi:hypothetical protein